jgi:threonine dehydrogenase-like Zn-dependent dehydrogenase
MLEVITETEMLQIPNAYIGGFLSHKTIRGGLCPGGRKRIERLLAMVKAERVDPSKMITHRFTGLESIEEAFYIMANKPRNLIKPIVIME